MAVTPTAQPADVSSRPLYIGSDERPLKAELHSPPHAAALRAGVVLCPPFGYEYVCAYRSFVNLADLLVHRGFAVLRFDYPGTGQSAGSIYAPSLLEDWIASVGLAFDELASRVDGPVLSVGLRLGASLALLDAVRFDRDAAVLWDPIVSGRRYSRELSALAATGAPMEPPLEDGTLSVAGQIVSKRLTAQLSALDLTRSGPYRLSRVLLLARDDRPPLAELEQQLRDGGVSIDQLSASGSERLLDTDAELAVTPRPILHGISDWLDTVAPKAARTTSHSAREIRTTWTLEVDGSALTEEVMRVGPAGLAAVVNRPIGRQPTRAVVFFNNGVATSVGPGRAWVDWARRAAVSGCLTVRVESRGIGDSPSGPSGRENTSYDATDIADAQSVIDWVVEQGVDKMSTVGLCSGGLLGLAVTARPGPVDRVVAINPLMYALYRVGVDGRRLPLRHRVLLWAMRKDKARRIALVAPSSFWSMVDAVGLYPSPGRYPTRSVAAGAKVLLVFGGNELGWFDLRRRGARALRRLEQRDSFAIEFVDDLDHSMFGLRAREEVWSLVGPFLLGHREDPVINDSETPQSSPLARS